jgi:Na+/H+ antiporter NhaC
MSDPLTVYFAGEKQGGALCLALAAVSVAFSIWVWRSHASFRAMAWPLVLVALAQLGVGAVLLARTGKQVETLQADLTRNPVGARAKELARMDRVNANFKIVEILEAGTIAVALVMAFAFRGRPAITAVGLGLLVQAAVMLAFDVFAEHRAHIYTAWLRSAGGG